MSLPETKQAGRGDPYRGVIIVLLSASAAGAAGAIWGGSQLSNPVLFAVALTLGLATCVLAGVATAQAVRMRPPGDTATPSIEGEIPQSRAAGASAEAAPATAVATEPEVAGDASQAAASAGGEAEEAAPPRVEFALKELRTGLKTISRRMTEWYLRRGKLRTVREAAAVIDAVAICWLLMAADTFGFPPYPAPAEIAIGICLIAALVAATAAKYLGEIEPKKLPEAPGLYRGARAVAWMFVLAAFSTGLAWANQRAALRILYYLLLGVDAALCYGLLEAKTRPEEASTVYPLDLGVLSVLGSRNNILGSILDSAERQLGIDLRSTWALAVLRRSLEPLLLSLLLIGWLSTSFTVVGIDEQGLVERFGLPVGGEPLRAGLHAHFPWPIDKVFRIPVRRVQVIDVGHEGEEKPGPEDVLWAVEHAPNEFTLVLGNGRDLITIDAGVQFRITDPRAYRYHCQNPDQALSAIAYRAVMRNTVNLTLSDALSQNVAILTSRMREMIQSEADALGLGVEVLGFTVGGMHPPVPVAKDYEGVVSAEVRKVTAVVDAQVFRVRVLPAAESAAVVGVNDAHADAAMGIGKAAGEAWSFRTLESQYRTEPGQYLFRRRLETLEKGLANRNFTLVDARFERDGGELWVIP